MKKPARQGFFLPVEIWQETMDVFDDLPHKRVKKITRAYEGLDQLTVTPKEAPSSQPEGPASPEGMGETGDATVRSIEQVG